MEGHCEAITDYTDKSGLVWVKSEFPFNEQLVYDYDNRRGDHRH